MEIIQTNLDIKEIFNFSKKTAVCIGFFDGVHKMHQQIIKKTKELSLLNNFGFGIITFSKKVISFIKGIEDEFESNETKYKKIKKIEIPDFILEIQTHEKVIKKTKLDFMDFLKNKINVKKIVIGSDFKFGEKASGDVKDLMDFFGEENIVVFDRVKGISSTELKKAKLVGDNKRIKEII